MRDTRPVLHTEGSGNSWPSCQPRTDCIGFRSPTADCARGALRTPRGGARASQREFWSGQLQGQHASAFYADLCQACQAQPSLQPLLSEQTGDGRPTRTCTCTCQSCPNSAFLLAHLKCPPVGIIWPIFSTVSNGSDHMNCCKINFGSTAFSLSCQARVS